MTPEEERAELERELAAELASLHIEEDDEFAESNSDDSDRYRRLDLQAVLLQVSTLEEPRTRSDDAGTWSRLLESVAYCETQVFQVFNAEMEELTTQIMPALTIVAQSVVAERGLQDAEVFTDEQTQRTSAQADGKEITSSIVAASVKDDSKVRVGEANTIDTACEVNCTLVPPEFDPKARDEIKGTARLWPVPVSQPREAVPPEKDGIVTTLKPQPELLTAPLEQNYRPLDVAEAPTKVVLEFDELTVTPQIDQIVMPTDSEPLRLRVQRNFIRAQQELDAWLHAREVELAREQMQTENRRREAALERDARGAMANEERAMRRLLERQRIERESTLMQQEDELSHAHATQLTQLAERECRERHQMVHEEARGWRAVRLERETQRKERLVEEQSRLRRWHRRVMDELVTTIASRQEAQRKREDAERRRAYRETSLMRSEEHWMRRVLVHERMVQEARERQRERREMEREDLLARTLQAEEWQVEEGQRQQQETTFMDREDVRSRVWETLWRLRMKWLRKWMSEEARRCVRQKWIQWRSVVHELREIELERLRDASACVIQRGIREWFMRRQRLNDETAQAARIVQSAFRGFHIRRKFQNALDMAQRMAFDGDEDEFGEVDLEKLIGAPPELDEDWELPTIPSERGAGREPAIDSDREEDEEDEGDQEHEEDNEQEDEMNQIDEEVLRSELPLAGTQRIATPKRPLPTVSEDMGTGSESGVNLAAVLWNKMRKRTQKQKLAQEERQRQQDPVYRVKKLLAKTAPSQPTNQSSVSATTTATVTSSITWATNPAKKKVPKVKLPSLVERLRKKTAAAR